ncbi:hypothetical protein Hdeb2414_s0005g00155571 [Helianthus debilis subsp. tardiflorus]
MKKSTSASAMKNVRLKLSYVYQCVNCDYFHLQPIGSTLSKVGLLFFFLNKPRAELTYLLQVCCLTTSVIAILIQGICCHNFLL